MKFLLGHRFWLHFPVGVVCALLLGVGLFRVDWMFFIWGISTGVGLGIGFLLYEILQERWKEDKASRDIRGAVAGFGITAVVLSAYMIWLG
jgi:Na+-translocating ferredoxin:NAD+ oxidoreductase RnfA subunit|tara:strand:+ start:5673 stop:5945 length:273 start_codon:yes stop_codon:yes gene_type:complete